VASPSGPRPIVRIPAGLLAAIEAEAETARPDEACGLLIGRRTAGGFEITRHAPSRNRATAPANRFEIDPLTQLHWQKTLRGTQEAVIGHYHSHPRGQPEPSATDIAEAHDPALLWLITGLEPRHTRAFTINRASQQVTTLPIQPDDRDADST
jgi:proteasome lid subunit RPN8/RPN11